MMRRRVATALFLLCLVTVWSATVSADDAVPDATTLEAKMAAALGPANANYRETIVESLANGSTSLITNAYRSGDCFSTVIRGKMRTTSGTLHGADWNQDENGVTYADLPDPGAAAKAKFTTTVRRISLPTDAYVLAVIDEDGYGYRLYIDPVTFLTKRRENVYEGGTTTVTFGEYKRYGTQLMPTSWAIEDMADTSVTSYMRTSFSLGGVAETDVAVPPVRQLVTFPSGVSSVDLHAAFNGATSYITVPVTIGNRRIYFLLDSGSSYTTIDDRVADELGLERLGNSMPTTDWAKEGQVLIPSMNISGLQMDGFVATRLRYGSGQSPDSPAGVLGFDFLAELIVNVDNGKQRVTVSDPRTFVAPVGHNVDAIPIRLGGRVPLITMDVAGAIAERMVVDTGSDDSLLMFRYFARRHGRVFRIRPSVNVMHSLEPTPMDGFVQGIDDGASIEHTSAPYIHLGHYSFREMAVDVINGTHGFPWNVDGLLGRQVLHAFDLVFDYEDGLIYLWPTATGP